MQDGYIIISVALLYAGVLVFAVYLNIWNYKRRSAMTREEKAREDAEMRTPGDW